MRPASWTATTSRRLIDAGLDVHRDLRELAAARTSPKRRPRSSSRRVALIGEPLVADAASTPRANVAFLPPGPVNLPSCRARPLDGSTPHSTASSASSCSRARSAGLACRGTDRRRRRAAAAAGTRGEARVADRDVDLARSRAELLGDDDREHGARAGADVLHAVLRRSTVPSRATTTRSTFQLPRPVCAPHRRGAAEAALDGSGVRAGTFRRFRPPDPLRAELPLERADRVRSFFRRTSSGSIPIFCGVAGRRSPRARTTPCGWPGARNARRAR